METHLLAKKGGNVLSIHHHQLADGLIGNARLLRCQVLCWCSMLVPAIRGGGENREGA